MNFHVKMLFSCSLACVIAMSVSCKTRRIDDNQNQIKSDDVAPPAPPAVGPNREIIDREAFENGRLALKSNFLAFQQKLPSKVASERAEDLREIRNLMVATGCVKNWTLPQGMQLQQSPSDDGPAPPSVGPDGEVYNREQFDKDRESLKKVFLGFQKTVEPGLGEDGSNRLREIRNLMITTGCVQNW